MIGRPVITLALVWLVGGSALAEDVYVLRFAGRGAMLSQCTQARWFDQVIFHNPSDTPAVVRLVNASYSMPPAGDSFVIPARTVTSVPPWFSWTPEHWDSFIGVVHLGVPDDVQVSSRTIAAIDHCVGPCMCVPHRELTGAVPHRVYRSLVQPGTPQVHLGADLPGASTRSNVQLYNAGTDTAQTTVEVRQTCDGAVLAATTVSVPPESLVTVGALEATPRLCQNTLENTVFVSVVSTKPGLSWVTSISNRAVLPRIEMLSPSH